MIRQLIRRILGAGSESAGKVKPKVYEKSAHGIALNDVSSNAMRVTQTLQDAGFKAFIVAAQYATCCWDFVLKISMLLPMPPRKKSNDCFDVLSLSVGVFKSCM